MHHTSRLCYGTYVYVYVLNLCISLLCCNLKVLEKGPSSYQSSVFQILHCMVHYIDISSPSSSVLNAELVHVIGKHVEVTYSQSPNTSLKMIKR